MAVKYTWDCKTVDTYPVYEDAQTPLNKEYDVIHTVHWKLVGKENKDGVEYSNEIVGFTKIDVNDLSNFTQFSLLTNKDVTGWVTSSLGSSKVSQYKENIKANIVEQQSPTSVIKIIES